MEKRVRLGLLFSIFFVMFLVLIAGVEAADKWMGYGSGCSGWGGPSCEPYLSGWPPSTGANCGDEFGDSYVRYDNWKFHGWKSEQTGDDWDDNGGMHGRNPIVPLWEDIDKKFSNEAGGCFGWATQCQVAYRCKQCSSGYANCDHDEWNQCEVNIRTDPNNCGECGHQCLAGQQCIDGSCVTLSTQNLCASAGYTWVKPQTTHALCSGDWENYIGCVADTNNNGLFDKKCCPVWNSYYGLVTFVEPAGLNPPCRQMG